ncbi:hypothetical protein FOVG_18406 [Fusarium oxysporum f. sp. pisi HDV247]|uniref:Uncharacterized protein n=1 Tax=Fusarium oxysporum f. sp. pisi HDV247 TaxID=1080344 RepID=W9NHJ1_FUSOX|nr:hypothetical protein FOVG_18406 [Fusarium oxysporum f. sp. pisi HDV247]
MTLVVLGLLGMRIEVLPGMHLASWPVTTARTLQKLRRSSKLGRMHTVILIIIGIQIGVVLPAPL